LLNFVKILVEAGKYISPKNLHRSWKVLCHLSVSSSLLICTILALPSKQKPKTKNEKVFIVCNRIIANDHNNDGSAGNRCVKRPAR